MARIVVCGYMVRYPMAGNMWAYFHYVMGLHLLGHEVVYLEESGWPQSCYTPSTQTWGDYPHEGLRSARELWDAYTPHVPLVYVDAATGHIEGMSREELLETLRTADLLVNVGGVCWLPEFEFCPRKALVDMDPLFTQVGRFGGDKLSRHQVHFTYGANIGRPGCSVPTCGLLWHPTVPPVVPELWQGAAPTPDAPFTTIANWSAYGGITHNGEYYGQKSEEFLRILDLPQMTKQRLELAISGASIAEIARLRAAGWHVLDAEAQVSGALATYRNYILHSKGELSVAKHAYVKTHSGWFSDRSVCYLAAGLPTVLQETGFSEWLPSEGRGVVPFGTVEEAAAALERVSADYDDHRRAARELAERVFSYQVVLPRLLEVALNATPVQTRLR